MERTALTGEDGRRAEARHACLRLMHRYAEALDNGDLNCLREIFAHATLRAEGQDGVSWQGGEGALRMLTAFTLFYDRQERPVEALREPGTPHTMHVLSNVDIEVAADLATATARSCYTVSQQLSDFPLQTIIQGRYRDRFERVDGAWRFSERVYVVSLVGDLSRHQKQPPPRAQGP